MISLRRNDKIIILIGVIILLAAGAGVALYSPSQVKTPTQQPTQPQTNYPIQWVEANGSLSTITETAAKGVPLSINESIGKAPIKSVSFHLSWIDDRALLRRFGLDTLTLTVKTPDNKEYTAFMKSQRRTKAGDFTLYANVSTQPSFKTIDGSNTQEATKNLEAKLKNDPWRTKDLNMTVTVTIGERFPFRFRDRGNDFTLEVNYTYWIPKIGNITGTGSDDIPTDFPEDDVTEPWTPPYMSMIIGTGCGRYV